MRSFNCMDRLLAEMDNTFQTFLKEPIEGAGVPESNLSDEPSAQRSSGLSGRLMRINHAGEIAAQGLYRGQTFTARSARVRAHMARSAAEEEEHLSLCSIRLRQLRAHRSYLDPFWYGGAFMLGALAGLAGDAWSLGFVAETEKQVVAHLDEHIRRLPKEDSETLRLLRRMRLDEQQHAYRAVSAGASNMAWPVSALMRAMSTVMTRTSYWI
jgi:3-demethoxyubiquinol 3-hydroxylase